MEQMLEGIWLDCLKQGILQNKNEFITFLRLLVQEGAHSILEIGCWTGGTARGFLALGRKVTSVDKEKKPMVAALEREYPDTFTFVQGDSSDALVHSEVEAMGEFDCLWIDGGHGYEDVKSDYLTYKGLVKDGGLICFHDIMPVPSASQNKCEVHIFWNEIRGDKYMEFVTDSRQEGLGIGILVNRIDSHLLGTRR